MCNSMTLLLPGIYFYKLHWAVTYGSAITKKFETWSVFFQRYRFRLLWLENYCSSWTNKHHVLTLHQNITSSKQRDEKVWRLQHKDPFMLQFWWKLTYYLFKFNNRNTTKKDVNMFQINNENTRTTSVTSSGVFIVNLEHISHLFLVFLLLALKK